MQEITKEIPGHDGYVVSSRGYIKHGDKVLKGSDNGSGYLRVCFEGSRKQEYVHRIVAKAFIPNPEHRRCVNHKDNNPKNNRVENLEWVTHQENTDWMVAQGRNKRTASWLKHLHDGQRSTYRAVIGTCIVTGNEIRFENLNKVREFGFRPGDVCRCCKGQRARAGGYSWRYAEE